MLGNLSVIDPVVDVGEPIGHILVNLLYELVRIVAQNIPLF